MRIRGMSSFTGTAVMPAFAHPDAAGSPHAISCSIASSLVIPMTASRSASWSPCTHSNSMLRISLSDSSSLRKKVVHSWGPIRLIRRGVFGCHLRMLG